VPVFTTEKSKIHTWNMKDSTIITDECRQLVRDLVSLNIVSEVIRIVAETLQVQVEGSIAVRSVGRIVLEGLVASNAQIAEEIMEGDSKS
jgi:hypothetical protein